MALPFLFPVRLDRGHGGAVKISWHRPQQVGIRRAANFAWFEAIGSWVCGSLMKQHGYSWHSTS